MVSKILITAATVVAAGASSITEEVDAPHRRLDSVGADNNRANANRDLNGWDSDGWGSSSSSGKSGKSGSKSSSSSGSGDWWGPSPSWGHSSSSSGKSGKSGSKSSSSSGSGDWWGPPPSWGHSSSSSGKSGKSGSKSSSSSSGDHWHGGWGSPGWWGSSSSSSGKSGKSGSKSSSSSGSRDWAEWSGGWGSSSSSSGKSGKSGSKSSSSSGSGDWAEWSGGWGSSSSSSSGKSGKSGSKSSSSSSSKDSWGHDGWGKHGWWGSSSSSSGKSGKSGSGKSGKSGSKSSSSSSHDWGHGGWGSWGWGSSSSSGKSGKSGSKSSSSSSDWGNDGWSGGKNDDDWGSSADDDWSSSSSKDSDDWAGDSFEKQEVVIYSKGGQVGGWKDDGWDNDGHYKADMDYVRAQVIQLIEESERELIPKFLRMGFHDCVGGCDGCIDLTNTDNTGLKEPIEALHPIYEEFQHSYSRADIWALATLVAADMSVLEDRPVGLHFPMRYIGRDDCEGADFTGVGGPDVEMPGNDLSTHELLEFFKEYFDFSTEETVIIMGVHAVAVAHRENVGFGNVGKEDGWVFDAEEYKMDNRYYSMLTDKHWELELVHNEDGIPSRHQWYHEEDGKDERPIMTNTDMGLVRDLSDNMYVDKDGNEGAVDCFFEESSNQYIRRTEEAYGKGKMAACPIASETMKFVEEYKMDNEAWLIDFEEVLEKMLKNGY